MLVVEVGVVLGILVGGRLHGSMFCLGGDELVELDVYTVAGVGLVHASPACQQVASTWLM